MAVGGEKRTGARQERGPGGDARPCAARPMRRGDGMRARGVARAALLISLCRVLCGHASPPRGRAARGPPAGPTPTPCPLSQGRGPAAARVSRNAAACAEAAAAFCAPSHGLGPALRRDALARDRRRGVTTIRRPPVNIQHACWPPRPALSCRAGRGDNATEGRGQVQGQGSPAPQDASGGESQGCTRCVDRE